MKLQNTYYTLLKENKNPCFIVDFHTDLVLSCNDEMKKLLVGKTDVIGFPYYKLFQEESTEKPDLNWDENSMLQEVFVSKSTEKPFQITYVRVDDPEKPLLLVQYSLVKSKSEDSIYLELAKQIEKLEITKEEKVKALLDILGEAYESDCSYVHVLNHGNKTIKLKYSWLSKEITDTTHYLVEDIEDMAGFDGLLLWAKARDDDGVWDCDLTRENSPNIVLDKLALSIFKRTNLILCGTEDDEKLLGIVVSIGDCKNLDVNHNLLKVITSMINDLI